jgi:stage V sporulation protein AC
MEQTKYDKQRYAEMVKKASPNSKILTDCLRAFLVGGAICAFGQIINNLLGMRLEKDDAALLTSFILIAISALLTGLGLYNLIGRHAGAGSVVPITGFANSVAAPAIEFKKEGLVLGVGGKMFVIAGPVIVYGALTSMVVGLVYYFLKG